MNKTAKNNVKQSEVYKSTDIAKTIEINEEIEEKEYLLRKFQKRYKTLWGTFILGVLVIILILLYTIYKIVTLPDTNKTMEKPVEIVQTTPSPSPTPTEEPISQSVSSKDLVYQLALPKIKTSKIEKTSLNDLVKTLGKEDILKYNGIDYYADGTGYIYESDNMKKVSIPNGVSLFSLSSLEDIIGNSHKVYELVDKPSKVTSKDPSNLSYCSIVREDSIETYYNKDILKKANPKNDILKTNVYDFTIQVYDDELSEDTIKEVLESFTYNRVYKDYENVIKAIANKLTKKINKFSISYDDYTFSYYDKVVKRDDTIIGVKGDDEEIPETVNTYNISDVEVVFDTLGCALKEHWY